MKSINLPEFDNYYEYQNKWDFKFILKLCDTAWEDAGKNYSFVAGRMVQEAQICTAINHCLRTSLIVV